MSMIGRRQEGRGPDLGEPRKRVDLDELDREVGSLVRPSPPPAAYVPPAHREAAQEDERRRSFIQALQSSPDPLALIGIMFCGLNLDQWLEASTKLQPFLDDERWRTPEGRVFVIREWAKTLATRGDRPAPPAPM